MTRPEQDHATSGERAQAMPRLAAVQSGFPGTESLDHADRYQPPSPSTTTSPQT